MGDNAMSHNYHPACGCYSCSRKAEAAERAAELAEPYIGALESNWSILSEAMGELSDDKLRDLAAKLSHCDFAAFGAEMLRKVAGYVQDKVADRMDERGCDQYEAASSLAEVYEVDMPAAALRAAA